MEKKNSTKLEKEWRNLALGEMQEEENQIDATDYEYGDGDDTSGRDIDL